MEEMGLGHKDRFRSISLIYETYGPVAIPKGLRYNLKVAYLIREERMGLAKTEAEIQDRVSRFLKAELKRAGVTYSELAERLAKHGLKGETEASVKNKLSRGTFAASFFMATLAALELPGVSLEDV